VARDPHGTNTRGSCCVEPNFPGGDLAGALRGGINGQSPLVNLVQIQGLGPRAIQTIADLAWDCSRICCYRAGVRLAAADFRIFPIERRRAHLRARPDGIRDRHGRHRGASGFRSEAWCMERTGLQTALEREARVGHSGIDRTGELCVGRTWRWWEGRRVSMWDLPCRTRNGCAACGRRMERTSWESQAYAAGDSNGPIAAAVR